ncbi:MAG: hypothetical protein K5876_02805 [Ruminiclostridium sp.]|nr:hypothetical protein [Ruminiclostridium sp.]
MKDERNFKILEPVALIATVCVISGVALAIFGWAFVKSLMAPGDFIHDTERLCKLVVQGVDLLAVLVAVIFMIIAMVKLRTFGTPFIAEVINGVNAVAYAAIFGGIVHMLIVGLYPMVIAMNSYNIADIGDQSFGCGAMVFGGFIMASAELLKYGVRTGSGSVRSDTPKPAEKPEPAEKTEPEE